jgi:DNA-binding CsgD family transcriptional regulator
MLICDEYRRCVDANVSACLFLRSSRERILQSRVDALAPPELRSELEARWPSFEGPTSPSRLVWMFDELAMPDGTRVAAVLSVAAIAPDRRLAVIDFPPVRSLVVAAGADGTSSPSARVLTDREREVLTLVALGNTGLRIAAQLHLSPATVQSHVNNALLKLNARNRAHGIAIAMAVGEIELGGVPLERSSPFSSRA